MKSPAFLITIGLLGVALLVGDSTPTLGLEDPGICRDKSFGSLSPELGTSSLQPITGLEEAKAQAQRCQENIPAYGKERCLRLAHLARLSFFLGEAGDQKTREQNYRQGRNYARLLIQERPERVEGYYWLALNLCGLASVSGAKNALGLLPRIVELLETSVQIDEAYDQAGAHRVLGRIYFQAPGWPLSLGSVDRSYNHLSRAAKLAPENSTNHLFFAEILYFLGEIKEANRELDKVMNGTKHALWPKGLEDDQKKAQELIKEYNGESDIAVSSGFQLPTRRAGDQIYSSDPFLTIYPWA